MKISVMILIMIVAFQALVSAQINQEDLIGKKIRSYTKMRNTGMIVTAAGGLLTIVGVGYYIKGINMEKEPAGYPYYELDGLGEQLAGILFITAGTCLGATGSIFWTIGSAKKNQYKEKLNSVSLYINPDPHKVLTLSLRF